MTGANDAYLRGVKGLGTARGRRQGAVWRKEAVVAGGWIRSGGITGVAGPIEGGAARGLRGSQAVRDRGCTDTTVQVGQGVGRAGWGWRVGRALRRTGRAFAGRKRGTEGALKTTRLG